MRTEPGGGSLAEFSARPLMQLALPVTNLEATRAFYRDLLGCRVIGSGAGWVEFDFFANRLTACLIERAAPPAIVAEVAGGELPIPHFGLVLAWDDWHRAVDHLNYVGVRYHISPNIQNADTDREQGMFILRDPSDNLVSFRAFRHPEAG